MGFRMGIVGLPNVGKSTLFNALTKTAAAQAANFPFCTIEPNVGDVAVPDARLDKLAEIAKSKQIIPTRMTFVDIAGLVKGASKGEGLGNQFLANIREVDAIAHVLRCFEDGDVTASYIFWKCNDFCCHALRLIFPYTIERIFLHRHKGIFLAFELFDLRRCMQPWVKPDLSPFRYIFF